MVGDRVRGAMVGAVVLVALGALAGCGSSKKTTINATTTTTTGSGSGSTTTTSGSGSGSTTTAAGTSGSVSEQLSAMASSIKAGEQSTFKAVYTYNSAGQSGTVTVEQEPPKTVFIAGGGEVIGTGTSTDYCSTAGTPPTCFSTGTSDPLASITQLFNPENAATAIQAAQAAAAAHSVGYNVSYSTQSFAGQSSNCATITSSSVTGKYCVTKNGILAYSGTASDSFQLTSFSSSVSSSDFSLPAGATIQTLPAGTP
jgi:hypothetical protein